MKGRKQYAEVLEQHLIRRIKHHLWNMDQSDGVNMASSGTGLLVFSVDVTEDRFWSV